MSSATVDGSFGSSSSLGVARGPSSAVVRMAAPLPICRFVQSLSFETSSMHWLTESRPWPLSVARRTFGSPFSFTPWEIPFCCSSRKGHVDGTGSGDSTHLFLTSSLTCSVMSLAYL